MTREDIISLARAEHGHPMKLMDLAQVWFPLHTHLRPMHSWAFCASLLPQCQDRCALMGRLADI